MDDGATQPAWAGPDRTRRAVGRGLLVLVGSLLGVALSVPVALGLARDRLLVASALYYQDSHPEMYRVARDPFLHYEPRPGRHEFGSVTYTVDALTTRGPTRPRRKPPGTLRILAAGGSTTFGFDVGDDATWPAKLEAALGGRARRPVEVWNLGVEGYVLSQVSERVRALSPALEPDLVLVQLYNAGRRPFLPGGALSLSRAVLADDDAVRENFTGWRADVPPGDVAGNVRRFRGSRAERAARALERLRADAQSSRYGDELSLVRSARMVAEARSRGVEVVFVLIPAARDAARYYREHLGVPARNLIELDASGLPPAWGDCHPPPDGLAWIARRVADELESRGFVRAAGVAR